MIVVDASALVAILLNVPEEREFVRRILSEGRAVVSAVNYWETLVRVQAVKGVAGRHEAEALLAKLNIRVVPADSEQARSAADAFARYGRKTPANLNLGDCFAYALAAEEGDGLLFKGNDFPKTDIKAALA